MLRVIKHHTEEGPCDMCGYPMYVGDKVLINVEHEVYLCSKACEKAYIVAVEAEDARATPGLE